LPTNVRLGQRLLAVANTLAYYDMATIMVVKRVMVQPQVSLSQNFFCGIMQYTNIFINNAIFWNWPEEGTYVAKIQQILRG
jgi:hypothetical protein